MKKNKSAKTKVFLIVGIFTLSILIFSIAERNSENTLLTDILQNKIPVYEKANFSEEPLIQYALAEKETYSKNISREEAVQAIKDAENIIAEMVKNKFSVFYMNDLLTEAKRRFAQAEYAYILRGEVSVSDEIKEEAKKVLSLIDWKNITYRDVLINTDEIKKRKDKAFFIFDQIIVQQNKIIGETIFNKESDFKAIISDETKDILVKAKKALDEERYADAEKLLKDFVNAFEKEKIDNSVVNQTKKTFTNFVKKYWLHLLIFSCLISIILYIIYKKFEREGIKKRIHKLIIEKKALLNLIKKTQEDRYNKNKISELIYNIRLKKYHDKIGEINDELPVLKSKIFKLKNKKKLKRKKW